MYRNMYDTDCITWSPQGRIFQVEYAMEAVKQGTCCVGLRSDTHVVLCSLKRAVSKLASHHQKLFKIDSHVGVAMSGITADAKVISNFMRSECLHHRYVFDSPVPVGRLVLMVADKSQANTQRSGKRPFGVGLLVAGYDDAGPHLFETCPSGSFFESYAMAFGARSQSCKTYLERHFESFPPLDLQQLVAHGLKALKHCLATETELTAATVAVGVVGKDTPWKELSEEEIQDLIDRTMLSGEAAAGDDVQMDTT